MTSKKFWTLQADGTEVLRDLKKENENFSRDAYLNGEFDANNYQWYEMFHHYNLCGYQNKIYQYHHIYLF